MRWIVALALSCLVLGCGEKQPETDIENIDPVYRLSRGETRSYTVSYVQSVSVRMVKETLVADRRYDAAFTLTREGEAETGFRAWITLDALDVSLVTKEGQEGFDSRQIVGKRLAATVAHKGGAPAYPDPSAMPPLDLGQGGGGEQHVSFLFDYAFPRLPSGVAKEGDTWETTVTRSHIEGTLPVTAAVTTTHRMTGFETIDGIRCMMVESRMSAPLSAVIEEDGKVWEYKGLLDGTAYWYFSPGTGALVRLSARESSQGATWATEVKASIRQKTAVDVRLVHDE